VRCAMGATRGRIMRQLATEGTLLAALGGAAALILAGWSADLLSAFSLPSPIPQRLHIHVNSRLIAFTAAMVAFAGLLPALVPAIQATRADLLRSMKMDSYGSGRSSRTRNVLVVAQVAGSTVFLAAAILCVRSFWNNAASSPGFDTERLLVMELNPANYGYDGARARILLTNLLDRLQALPGVQKAALADRLPFYVGFPNYTDVSLDARDCDAGGCHRVGVYAVGAGHFTALAVPLKDGRDFTEQDTGEGEAVVVSETMAMQLWPGQRAVGQTLREGERLVHVVGVASDIKHHSFYEPPRPYLYRPVRHGELANGATVVVRTSGDPRALLGVVRDQVSALDAHLPPSSLKTMTQRMEMPLWPARMAARFFAVCGTLALVLATVGLFGVTYFAVNRRTREFGVRVALGATPRAVISQVLQEGLMLTLPGIALGVGGAMIAGRLASAALLCVSPYDPATYAATALLQTIVTLGACALPAYRATMVDPIATLRSG
jgi:predicted permease